MIKIYSFLVASALATAAGAGVVRLEGGEGSWTLLRDGRPFFICGAGDGSVVVSTASSFMILIR